MGENLKKKVMTIEDFIIPKGTLVEYGYGQHGLGIYFYDVIGKIILFVKERE